MSKAPPPSLSPLPTDLLKQLGPLSPLQLAWLSGYCWSRCEQAESAQLLTGLASDTQNATDPTTAASAVVVRRVTVLSASQTGNARRVAEQLHKALAEQGVNARLVGAADFKSKTLPDEDILLLVSSTQGEGEPPEEAVPLHKLLFGKKAPDLGKLSFAVLGLGDSSYPDFCQAGKDFDAQLAKLGATRLADRGDCDLDYQAAANAWIDATVPRIVELTKAASGAATSGVGTGLSSGSSVQGIQADTLGLGSAPPASACGRTKLQPRSPFRRQPLGSPKNHGPQRRKGCRTHRDRSGRVEHPVSGGRFAGRLAPQRQHARGRDPRTAPVERR